MKRISPCLWFDNQAEEAAQFYTSIFDNSRIVTVTHYGEESARAGRRPAGSVMTVVFELEGQEFMALNGGPVFQFSPALSLIVYCETQEEIDRIWGTLSADPKSEQCGWLKDRYGVSWQIVPEILAEAMADPDRRERWMQAVLQMKKLDIEALRRA